MHITDKCWVRTPTQARKLHFATISSRLSYSTGAACQGTAASLPIPTSSTDNFKTIAKMGCFNDDKDSGYSSDHSTSYSTPSLGSFAFDGLLKSERTEHPQYQTRSHQSATRKRRTAHQSLPGATTRDEIKPFQRPPTNRSAKDNSYFEVWQSYIRQWDETSRLSRGDQRKEWRLQKEESIKKRDAAGDKCMALLRQRMPERRWCGGCTDGTGRTLELYVAAGSSSIGPGID